MRRFIVHLTSASLLAVGLAALVPSSATRNAWRSALSTLSAPLAAATSCENLATMALPNATIARAETIAAGAFTPPPAPARGRAAAQGGAAAGAPQGGGATRGGGGGGNQFADLPAFCRVLATIKTSEASSIKFEVWMPVAGWNGNFMSNGFAFYGGTMAPGPLAGALRRGYATATTDLGGDGTNSAAYLTGHPESLIDWNERGWHETTLKAKALVAAYYGSGPKLSYWESCGGGTRQGLKEIARFPTDYDALSAGGLSNGTTFFTFSQIWQWDVTHRDPIPREKLQVLHTAALDACDAKDGVKDGIIQDPEHCTVNPAVVQCKAGDAPDCLTAAQVDTARKLYTPVTNPRTKEWISGPLMPGSELSWPQNRNEVPTGFGADFFRYLVFQDPNWDYRSRPINYDGDFALANRPEIGAISAVEPDLRPFFRRGGKILMYVGWNDGAIPPLDSTRYYTNIVSKSGSLGRDGVRLFMIPDMGHCPANATAANGYLFDPLPVITEWKEQGKTPNQIVVSHKANGVEDRKALVCPYPQQAMYKGAGSTNDPTNFVCKAR